jgi:hypothetical protein
VVAYYTLMIRLLSAFSLVAAFTLQGPPGGDGWARVASLYHQRLQDAGIVGSSLMFVKNGAVAHQAFEGYQDRATKRGVDEETIFHWASITKTFTGIAIMQLRDRGLLSLDDPAVKYVPELREVHNPYGDISQVTIRHLMTHSAGFRAGTWPWGGDRRGIRVRADPAGRVVAMMPAPSSSFGQAPPTSHLNPGVIFPPHHRAFRRRHEEWHQQEHLHAAFARPAASSIGVRSSGRPQIASYAGTREGTTEQRFTPMKRHHRLERRAAPPGDTKYLAFLIDGNETILEGAFFDEMFGRRSAADGEGGSGDDVQVGLSCSSISWWRRKLTDTAAIRTGSSALYSLTDQSGYIVSFNTDVTSKRAATHDAGRGQRFARRSCGNGRELAMTLDGLRQRAGPRPHHRGRSGAGPLFLCRRKAFAAVIRSHRNARLQMYA